MEEKKEYVILCDFDSNHIDLYNIINEYLHTNEKYSSIKVINMNDSEFDMSMLSTLHVDNYIFEKNDKVQEIVKLLKTNNPDIVTTFIDYANSYKEDYEHIYEQMENLGTIVQPGYINVTERDIFDNKNNNDKNEKNINQGNEIIEKDINQENEIIEKNIENSLFYLMKQITNAYEYSKKKEKDKEIDISNVEKLDFNSELTKDEQFIQLVNMTAEVLESTSEKDMYTNGHVNRVSHIAGMIGKELKLSATERDILRMMALMHDTGKILTQSEVLKYQGFHGKEMNESMSAHSNVGLDVFTILLNNKYGLNIKSEDVLKGDIKDKNGNVLFSDKINDIIKSVGYGIKNHHKKFSDAEKDEYGNISKLDTFVQIIAFADSFDAATSDREYNCPKTIAEFLADAAYNSGGQFDSKVTQAFLSYLTKELPDDCGISKNIEDYVSIHTGRRNKDDGLKILPVDESIKKQEEFNAKCSEKIDELRKLLKVDEKNYFATFFDKVTKYIGRYDDRFDNDRKLKEGYLNYADSQGVEVSKDYNKEVNQKYKSLTVVNEKSPLRKFINSFTSKFKKGKREEFKSEDENLIVQNSNDEGAKFKESLKDGVQNNVPEVKNKSSNEKQIDEQDVSL